MKNLLLLIFFFNFLLLDSKKTYSIGKDSNKLNLLRNNQKKVQEENKKISKNKLMQKSKYKKRKPPVKSKKLKNKINTNIKEILKKGESIKGGIKSLEESIKDSNNKDLITSWNDLKTNIQNKNNIKPHIEKIKSIATENKLEDIILKIKNTEELFELLIPLFNTDTAKKEENVEKKEENIIKNNNDTKTPESEKSIQQEPIKIESSTKEKEKKEEINKQEIKKDLTLSLSNINLEINNKENIETKLPEAIKIESSNKKKEDANFVENEENEEKIKKKFSIMQEKAKEEINNEKKVADFVENNEDNEIEEYLKGENKEKDLITKELKKKTKEQTELNNKKFFKNGLAKKFPKLESILEKSKEEDLAEKEVIQNNKNNILVKNALKDIYEEKDLIIKELEIKKQENEGRIKKQSSVVQKEGQAEKKEGNIEVNSIPPNPRNQVFNNIRPKIFNSQKRDSQAIKEMLKNKENRERVSNFLHKYNETKREIENKKEILKLKPADRII